MDRQATAWEIARTTREKRTSRRWPNVVWGVLVGRTGGRVVQRAIEPQRRAVWSPTHDVTGRYALYPKGPPPGIPDVETQFSV